MANLATPQPGLGARETCPDENTLQCVAEGGLTASAAAEVFAHAQGCRSCRQVLDHLGAQEVMAPPREAAPSRIGRYVLLEELGAGTFGVVYAAFDPELDRRVAVKLVRRRPGEPPPREVLERLKREAKALAQVTHPNVIAVHDVGVHGDQVYITEEFVRGSNLGDWLRAEPRSTQKVLEVFQQAGRGLAAAHRAGLVHRDFKPANVLVGEDGRIRVVDFGMARLEDNDLPASDVGDPTGLALTRTGTVVGTPLYMSPEQHRAQPVDPRSDQFSFCVSLYEGLYGQHPFPAETFAQLSQAVLAGDVATPPRSARVPPRVHAAVQRGLRPRPEERFPSMDALLDALALDDRARWRRRAAIGGGVLVLAASVAIAGVGVRERRQLCRGAAEKLKGIWDGERAAAMRAGFARSGVSYSAAAADAVQRMLDRYAAEWATQHTETCEATRLRGEQSEQMLDLRMGCLSQRRAELKAVADFLVTADASAVQRSTTVLATLTPLSGCADVEALQSPLPPPRDVQARARVDQLRSQLATGWALNAGARYAEARAAAVPALDAARAIQYGPVIAEALDEMGALEQRSRKDGAAEQTYEEGFETALASRDDPLAEKIAARLVTHVGRDLGRHADGHRWAAIAHALSGRVGGGSLDPGGLEFAEGNLFLDEGKFQAALDQFRTCLVLREKALPPDDPRVARAHNSVGRALWALGKGDDALVEYRRCLALQQQLVPGHPDLAATLNNIGVVLTNQGHYEEALAELWRAESIYEKAVGPENPEVALALTNIADLLEKQKKYGEALPIMERAQAIFEKSMGPENPEVLDGYYNLASLHVDLGQLAKARSELEHALELEIKVLGKDHPNTVDTSGALGSVLCDQGERRRGEALLREAIEKTQRQSSRQTMLGSFRFNLARALWTDGSRAEALRLAEQAREDWSKRADEAEKLADLQRWLASRARPE
jgi:tetratricopeptide (TPR) repeat protein/predicted Ser/Thr protein kinase